MDYSRSPLSQASDFLPYRVGSRRELSTLGEGQAAGALRSVPDTIILADDHPLFRDGLRSMVGLLLPKAEVVAVDTLGEVLGRARQMAAPPVMIILDLFFARASIRPELKALRQEFDRSSIVIVSMADDRETVRSVMEQGVDGFISKSASPDAICAAITAIIGGDIVVEIPPSETLTQDPALPLPPLPSERQRQVLGMLAHGKTNKEIGQALDISPFTVRIHVSALFRSLGVTNRTGAVAKAISDGLLSLD